MTDPFTHNVWGDTDELTPPPALDNPLIITDYSVEGLRRGPDGQTIRGWSQPLEQRYGYTINPDGEVWHVNIDGNGGDVWLKANRPAGGPHEPINFSISVDNVRNLRVTGLEADVTDIMDVNGYSPDDETGFDQILKIADVSGGGSVFIEGVNLAMNSGGATPTYRTDAISAFRLGSPDDPIDLFAIQNSRITGVGSTRTSPDSHADGIHFQRKSYIKQFASENVFGDTAYQFFQMNYSEMRAGADPTSELHSRFYNTHLVASDVPVLFTNNERTRNFADFMSLEFDETYLNVPSELSPELYPRTIYSYTPGAGHVVFEEEYRAARSKVRQADDDLQSGMVAGERELHIIHDIAEMPLDPAPASETGSHYATMWAADGSLMNPTEGEVNSTQDAATTTEYDVVYSAEATRAAPLDLDGATLAPGTRIYAFLANSDSAIQKVEFFLDGERIATENYAPWDIDGGTHARANGFNTTDLHTGAHTVDTVVTYVSDREPKQTVLRDTFILGASSPDEITPSTGTGIDELVKAIVTDEVLKSQLTVDEIVAGATAADRMNELIVDGIHATGIVNDGDFDRPDIRVLSDYLTATHGALWADLHGNDDGIAGSGFHVLKTASHNEIKLFGLEAIDIVADEIYHLGFRNEDDFVLDENNQKNQHFTKIIDYLTDIFMDDIHTTALQNPDLDFEVTPSTGTGIDVVVKWIFEDDVINSQLSAAEIAEGAVAADRMNRLLVEGIGATGIVEDGDFDRSDIGILSDYLTNMHGEEWRELHGTGSGEDASGFHVLKTASHNEIKVFGLEAIDILADQFFHLGFGHKSDFVLDQDGARDQHFSKMADHLNQIFSIDLANETLVNIDIDL